MIPVAQLAALLAQIHGYWIVFVLALVALPLRSLLADSLSTHGYLLVPVQMLDGISAGLLGVAVPASSLAC